MAYLCVFQRHQKSTMKILYNEHPSHFKSIFCCLLCDARSAQRIAFNRVAAHTHICCCCYVKNHTFSSTHVGFKLLLTHPLLPLELTFSHSLIWWQHKQHTTAHHLDNGFVTYFAFSAHHSEISSIRSYLCATHTHTSHMYTLAEPGCLTGNCICYTWKCD